MVSSRHVPVTLAPQSLQHCLQVQHLPAETKGKIKLFSTKTACLIVMEGMKTGVPKHYFFLFFRLIYL